MMKKMIKKFIVGIVLITMLVPVGVWTMDNNDEELKENGEEYSPGRSLFVEVTRALSMKDLTPNQRRALLSPAAQEWIDHDIVNQPCGFSIKNLCDIGANVNARNEQGESALEREIKDCDLENVEYLLKHGALMDEQMRIGIEQLRLNVKLLAAIREKRKNEVEALLNARADVNYQDLDGSRPLDSASFLGFYEIVELLLDRGADVGKVSASVYSKGLCLIPDALVNALTSIENIGVVRALIIAGAQIETRYDLETAHLEITSGEDSYNGVLRKIYRLYSLVDPFAQAIIYALAMRAMLGEQDWLSEDVQKDSSLMAYLPVPGLRGLVGDYADFYDEACACDYGPLNKNSDCDKILALVSEYAVMREDDGETVPDYVSFYRIIKREIERRRRRREAGQPRVLAVQVERPVVNVQAVVEEEETKEAAAAVSYNFVAQGSEEDVQEVACFNCTLLNSAGQSTCRACGAQLSDIDGFFDQQ